MGETQAGRTDAKTAANGPDPAARSAPSDAAHAANFMRREFGTLPIALSTRIAVGRANLAELRDLAPGQVLPLETPVGESCRLIADGAVIGAGELVEVKGQLALRVTRLGRDDG
jgi:type III secretion protein Q